MEPVEVGPLREDELAEADRVFRLAFSTFLGIPNPARFFEGADYVRTRWKTDSSAAFAARGAGHLLGSNFATRWGSVGFFGPLTVRPDAWDQGIGKRLMDPILERFRTWGVTQAGLFTFPHSAKHVGLYMRYGFWPRYLTGVMEAPVDASRASTGTQAYSELSPARKEEALSGFRALASEAYPGLDLATEIRSVDAQRLGDTLFLPGGEATGGVEGFAVCQGGAGTEGGPETWYAKFAMVRGGPGARRRFDRLLDACHATAAARGLRTLQAGANTARREAYSALLERGFRTRMQGVAMQRDDKPGYNRPGVWLLDDWR